MSSREEGVPGIMPYAIFDENIPPSGIREYRTAWKQNLALDQVTEAQFTVKNIFLKEP